MRFVVIAAAICAAVPAFAADDAPVDATPTVAYPKVTEVEFGELTVEGTFIGPSGTQIAEARRLTFPSMIDLRDDFTIEMAQSVSYVR